MITTFVAMLFGMLVGLAAVGPLGGAFGLVLGGTAGMLLEAGRNATRLAPAGVPTVLEEHRLLCVPKGQVATATFVRDTRRGRWLDVARCSLCGPDDQVGCAKRCLHLMRDTLKPRQHPVHVPDEPPAA